MVRDILTELRPRRFGDIAGNEGITAALRLLVAEDRVPSAVLITGESGSGKSTLASVLARTLGCKDWKPGISEPCGECKSCG